ncbi:MAG: hypothetical protein ABW168_22105 [Sedimenticola sp.]
MPQPAAAFNRRFAHKGVSVGKTYVNDVVRRHQYEILTLRKRFKHLEYYIVKELEAARLGINTFDSAATELIIRSAQGNLRLCRNLCYGSLVEVCRETKKIVTITHANGVLVQPHWRPHEELIKQQVA